MLETTTFDAVNIASDDEILRNQVLYIASKRKQALINQHIDQLYSKTFKQWEHDVNMYIDQLETFNNLLKAAQYQIRSDVIGKGLNDAITSITLCAKQFDHLFDVINKLATRSNVYTESSSTLDKLKDRIDSIVESSNFLIDLIDIGMANTVRTYQMEIRSLNQKIAISVDKLQSLTIDSLKAHANSGEKLSESDFDYTLTSEDDEMFQE